MNAQVLKNSALRTLTSRTRPDDCRVKSARPPAVAAIDACPPLIARPRPGAQAPRHGRGASPRRLHAAAGESPDLEGVASILTATRAGTSMRRRISNESSDGAWAMTTSAPGSGASVRTLDDPLAEALRIVDLASARSLLIRLMGGLAFHAQAPSWTARVSRDGRDIDLATRGADRKGVAELLAEEGYTPDRQYNALYGHKQLYFVDEAHGRPVDVLVDRLEMCHTFEFRDRLAAASPTLPLAELLLSKLQVVKITRKDVLDALILLAEHPLADGDGAPDVRDGAATISTRRVAG